MIEGMLLPAPDEHSLPFFDYLADDELRIQACGSCGRRRMPPRPMCPHCNSLDESWDLMSGAATVWSVVVPHPPLLPAYSEQAPYNVVVVELDDDPSIRLVGNVVTDASAALDSIDPHTVEIGMKVRVVFTDPFDDGEGPIVLPRWVPA